MGVGQEGSSPRRVLAIVPALNERRSVPAVVADLRRHAPEVDVVVVDDGSTDGTGDVARALGVLVLTLPFNLGVGGAMRAGFRYALRKGYDAAVQVDADGQHDVSALPALLAALDDADIAIGARFAGMGDYVVRGPRRWAMRLLAHQLSRAVGTRLTDATSGFRACNVRAMRLFAQHYPVEYLGDTVEALLIAGRNDLRVVQVPVVMRARAHGRPSQNPAKATLYLLRACMALTLAAVRQWPQEQVEPGVLDAHEARVVGS